MSSINNMQPPRSPNIAELGLVLFSSCANINGLQTIDVTPPRLGLLLAACRRGPYQMADRWRMDGIQRHRGASEANVASIFIRYVDMHQTNLNVTYPWHRQDPLIDDDILIDNMRYIVRSRFVIFIQSILRVPFPLTIYSFWKLTHHRYWSYACGVRR